MAYYSYSYDGDNQGGYYNGGYSITPYNSSYDSSSDHDSVAYSSYNYNQNQGFSYDPPSYYAAYDPVSSYSRTAYSESTFSEPMCIKYDPGNYYHEQTRFIVSYDVSEFNETDFEEYDPTPYDGGFDLAAIYGKPLPPSAETCYPRSTPDPNVASLDGFSYGSIIAPYGKDEVSEPAAKPQSGSKPISPPPIEAAPVPLEFSDGHGNSQEKVQRDEDSEGKGADHPDPWPGYDTGIARDWPQVPSGYGLEAMDLCEGLFGYWPCLSRYARNNHDCQKAADCGSSDPCCGRWDDGGSGYGHQWKVTTADYLFGSSNPYGDRRDDGGGSSFGNVTYGYERHYQEEPLFYQQHYQEEPLYYQQVKYVEDPWRS